MAELNNENSVFGRSSTISSLAFSGIGGQGVLVGNLRSAANKVTLRGTRVRGGDCMVVDLSSGQRTSCTYHLDETYESFRVTTAHIAGNVRDASASKAKMFVKKAKFATGYDNYVKEEPKREARNEIIIPLAAVEKICTWPEEKEEFKLSEHVWKDLLQKGGMEEMVLLISPTRIRRSMHRVCLSVKDARQFIQGITFLAFYAREAVKSRHLVSLIGCFSTPHHRPVTAQELVDHQVYDTHRASDGNSFNHSDIDTPMHSARTDYTIVRNDNGAAAILNGDEIVELEPSDLSAEMRSSAPLNPKDDSMTIIDNRTDQSQDLAEVRAHRGQEWRLAQAKGSTYISPDAEHGSAHVASLSSLDKAGGSSEEQRGSMDIDLAAELVPSGSMDIDLAAELVGIELVAEQEAKEAAEREAREAAELEAKEASERAVVSWEEKAQSLQMIGQRSLERMRQREEARKRQEEEEERVIQLEEELLQLQQQHLQSRRRSIKLSNGQSPEAFMGNQTANNSQPQSAVKAPQQLERPAPARLNGVIEKAVYDEKVCWFTLEG